MLLIDIAITAFVVGFAVAFNVAFTWEEEEGQF